MVTIAICNNCGHVYTDTYDILYGHKRVCPHTTITYSDMYDTPENRAIYDWPAPRADGAYNHVVDTWVDDAGQAWMRVEQRGTQGGRTHIHQTITHPAETHTEIVHHDAEYQTVTGNVWVEDKPAWTEEIVTPQYEDVTEQVWVVDMAAWTETVVTGQRCTICGAMK